MTPCTATAGLDPAGLSTAGPPAPSPTGLAARLLRGLAQAVLGIAALAAAGAAQAFNPGPYEGNVTTVAIQPDDGIVLTGTFSGVGEESRNGFARLHADGSVDLNWHVPAVARAASTAAVLPDGAVLIGGKGVQGNGGLLRIRADGTLDTTFTDAISSGSATITRILPLASGKILIAGGFQSVGGQPRRNLARLNADGTLDPTFDAGTAFSWGPRALLEQPDGRILAGAYGIMLRLLPDGAPDTVQPLAALSSAPDIRAFALQPDGKILVGSDGDMVFTGSPTRHRVVRLNADGTFDTSFAANLGGIVEALHLQADGAVLVAGSIHSVDGQERNGVVRLTATGALDPTFHALVIENPTIAALGVQSTGKLVIGGYYTRINGLLRGRLSRLHPDGRLDNGATAPWTVTPRGGANGSIGPAVPQAVEEGARISFTLTPDAGFAVGSVTGCGGSRVGDEYLTSWVFADCTVVASFVPDGQQVFNPDANARVEKIALQPDGGIAAVGWFSRIGLLRKIKFARLDPLDGRADEDYVDASGLLTSTTAGDVVYATAVQADGKTLFGGQNGVLRRVNVDGSFDTGFDVEFDGYATINTIVPTADGKLFVGGNFSSVNGVARPHIVRLHADGSVDTSFDPGTGPNSELYAIVVQPDGRVIVGGGFGSFAGQGGVGLARLSATGAVDPLFPGAGTSVYALHRLADGSLLVGGGGPIDLGDGGLAQSALVKLTAAGARDSSFEAMVTGGWGGVNGIAVQADGNIVVVGAFGAVDGVTSPWLARLNPNGTRDTTFTTPVIDSYLSTVALQTDGKVLIGGGFVSVDGYLRSGIARLKTDGSIDVEAFVVTPLASANGTVTPNAPQSVEPGAQTQFTIVPDAGYVIGPVSGCDGSLDGLVYTTGLAVDHCTVTIDFVMDQVSYNVTPAAGPNGQIWPPTPQSVLFAQTTGFEVYADPGYYITSVEGCQGTLDGTTYITGRILADCAVIARFGKPTALAATGGTPQSTAVGTAFAAPLDVRVTDGSGLPLAGVLVSFAAPSTGASAVLSSSFAYTDSEGRARITARANAEGGSYLVTATVESLQRTFALSNEAIERGGIDFKVTVSREPAPACGTATEIDAIPGEQLNYCFTATNRSNVTLNYHTLTLITFGYSFQYHTWFEDRFFHEWQRSLAPGETMRYNRLISAGTDDQAPLFTWSATATAPDYEKDADADVAFTDISGTGTALTLGPTGVHQLTSLPFPITYFGDVFLDGDLGNLCINNSGTVSLRRGSGEEICPTATAFTAPPLVGDNGPMPALGFPDSASNGLAVYWDFLGSRGRVYHDTVGDAPNRRFIVQWDGKDHALYPNPSQGITFQLVIEEGSGRIHYVYRNLNFDVVASENPDRGGSATVGLLGYTYQYAAQFVPPYRQHSFDQTVLSSGQAITWTPTAVPRYASAGVSVDVGAPHVNVTPAAIDAQAASGTSTTRSVNVGNSGDMALTWSLDEAAALAHFPSPTLPTWMPPADDVLPEHFRIAGRAAPADNTPSSTQAVFAVPAYAYSGTYLNGTTRGAVSFDASHPTQLVHGTGVPYIDGEAIWAADFAGNDFSHVYVFGYGGATSQSEFALARPSTTTYEPNWIGEALPENPYLAPHPRWSGTTWDSSNDTLYAVTTGYNNCEVANVSDLYTVDVTTAATTRIGNIDAGQPLCIRGLAVSPDGALFGIDDYNNTLVAIDKATGDAAIVGWLGFNIEGQISADFDDASGVLYLANGSAIYSVDLVTGLASLVGALPQVFETSPTLEGLSIAVAGGACARPSEIPWLSVNQTAGTTAPGAQSRIDLVLDADGLASGEYSANVCLFSNDRSQSMVRVPVRFTVVDGEGGEVVFADGFE